MVLQSTEYRHFRNAVIFSLVLGLVAGIFLLVLGKENALLVINKYNSPTFDYVFRSWTYLGDGLIWIPLFAYVLFFRRDYFLAVLAGLIICTVLTHFLKRVVFPNDFRPIVILGDKVRAIPGYHMNRANSFPSGHTSTAYTLALLLAFISTRKIWIYIFPLIAFFVGYSRVYLAQHFVGDVVAGTFIGIISAYLALLVYERFRKEKHLPPASVPTSDLSAEKT